MQLSRNMLFLLLLGFFGCAEPFQPIVEVDTPYILEESAFGCNKYDAFEFQNLPFFNKVAKLGNNYFLAVDGGIIATERAKGEILNQYKLKPNEILNQANRVVVCADEGVFTINTNLKLKKHSDLTCDHITLGGNDNFIFGALNLEGGHDLYEINPITDSIQTYGNYPNSSCVSVAELETANTGEVWMIDCSGVIFQFRNGDFLKKWDTSNAPLPEISGDHFLFPYRDQMIYVFQNGIRHDILKFIDGEWIVMRRFGVEDEPLERDLEIAKPDIVDGVVISDNLVLGTTLAGCPGFQRFNLSVNRLNPANDYKIITDPLISSYCVNDMFIHPDGQILLVTDQLNITEISCP